MPQFMDVHTGMEGITTEALAEAHEADLAIQSEEGVDFKQAWADPTTGTPSCMASSSGKPKPSSSDG